MQNHEQKQEAGEHGEKDRVRLRVQTPRGLWSIKEPADAKLRPEYRVSTKVQRVIEDARSVFKFIENDSKYTLFHDQQPLDPERTLASYKIENDTLLTLSVQGGNA